MCYGGEKKKGRHKRKYPLIENREFNSKEKSHINLIQRKRNTFPVSSPYFSRNFTYFLQITSKKFDPATTEDKKNKITSKIVCCQKWKQKRGIYHFGKDLRELAAFYFSFFLVTLFYFCFR